MSLSPQHLADLKASGLSDETIEARGYETIEVKAELRRLGFGVSQQIVPSLLVPLWGPKGDPIGYQIKPDEPRSKIVPGKKPRILKYESANGSGNVVDVPPGCRKDIDDPTVALWITEGAKKADRAVQEGLCCVDLSGVWNWRGTNAKGGKVALPIWDDIPLNGRLVYLAFDSDSSQNEGVWLAMVSLGEWLDRRGAQVRFVAIPSDKGNKVGLDDWFEAGNDVVTLTYRYTSIAPPSRPGTQTSFEDDPGGPFDPTDVGNGQRIATLYGDRLRHCADWDAFLHLNENGVWHRDAPGDPEARELAKSSARIMADSESEGIRSWGKSSLMTGKINAAMKETQSIPTVSVRSYRLDGYPRLLAVANGVVDLETGDMIEDPGGLLITRSSPVTYDPDATCPIFEDFLQTIMRGDLEMVEMLIRCLGYCLSGDTSAQKFFLLYGERARNGKSTIIETMNALLGPELSGPINKRLLNETHEDNARFAMSGLEGKRFTYAEETKNSSKFDVSFLKEFAAGKVVQSEKKGKDEESFKLQAKLMYAVNALPRVDWDNAFANRCVPIPFEQSFFNKDEAEYMEGDLPRDETLPDRLLTELPGILALLVQGAIMYFSKEDGGLKITDKVRKTAAEYRQENDLIGSFLDQCCEKAQNVETTARLYATYDAWCVRNRFARTSIIGFGRALRPAAEKRGYVVRHYDPAKGDYVMEKVGGSPVVRGISIKEVDAYNDAPHQGSMAY